MNESQLDLVCEAWCEFCNDVYDTLCWLLDGIAEIVDYVVDTINYANKKYDTNLLLVKNENNNYTKPYIKIKANARSKI